MKGFLNKVKGTVSRTNAADDAKSNSVAASAADTTPRADVILPKGHGKRYVIYKIENFMLRGIYIKLVLYIIISVISVYVYVYMYVYIGEVHWQNNKNLKLY